MPAVEPPFRDAPAP